MTKNKIMLNKIVFFLTGIQQSSASSASRSSKSNKLAYNRIINEPGVGYIHSGFGVGVGTGVIDAAPRLLA